MFTDLFDGLALWPRPEGGLWLLLAAVVIPLAMLTMVIGATVGFIFVFFDRRNKSVARLVRWTIAAWLVCVAGLGYWFIVVWPPGRTLTDEYASWWDYRLAFFLIAWFPPLIVALVVILMVERAIYRRQASQTNVSRHR